MGIGVVESVDGEHQYNPSYGHSKNAQFTNLTFSTPLHHFRLSHCIPAGGISCATVRENFWLCNSKHVGCIGWCLVNWANFAILRQIHTLPIRWVGVIWHLSTPKLFWMSRDKVRVNSVFWLAVMHVGGIVICNSLEIVVNSVHFAATHCNKQLTVGVRLVLFSSIVYGHLIVLIDGRCSGLVRPVLSFDCICNLAPHILTSWLLWLELSAIWHQHHPSLKPVLAEGPLNVFHFTLWAVSVSLVSGSLILTGKSVNCEEIWSLIRRENSDRSSVGASECFNCVIL